MANTILCSYRIRFDTLKDLDNLAHLLAVEQGGGAAALNRCTRTYAIHEAISRLVAQLTGSGLQGLHPEKPKKRLTGKRK